MKRSGRLTRQLTLLAFLSVAPLAGCASPSQEAPQVTTGPKPVAAAPAPMPLDPAAAARLERVRQSLEQGLDVNEADDGGRTPLMMAAFDGITEVVALLLEHGARVDQRDGTGRTALMYASSGPFYETVELLLQHGASVNTADTVESWTALMFAAAEGHQPVVATLLSHGADPGMADEDGDAAIEHARQRGQTSIVTLLESWPPGE